MKDEIKDEDKKKPARKILSETEKKKRAAKRKATARKKAKMQRESDLAERKTLRAENVARKAIEAARKKIAPKKKRAPCNPTKLNEQLLEDFQYYMNNWRKSRCIPSIAGLALHLNVARETLHAWHNRKSPENASDEITETFKHMMNILGATQELEVLDGSLKGKLKEGVSKMILTKHGYADKVELDNRSGDGSMSPKFDKDKYKSAQCNLSDLD